jgi:hypothetical protein
MRLHCFSPLKSQSCELSDLYTAKSKSFTSLSKVAAIRSTRYGQFFRGGRSKVNIHERVGAFWFRNMVTWKRSYGEVFLSL